MKILNKLTLKNLRLNKSRTIVTVIGIMLSTALITFVAGIASSAQQTLVNMQIYSVGDYEFRFSGNVNNKNIETTQNNRNVETVYFTDSIGCAKMPSPELKNKPYVFIKALSTNSFEKCFKTKLSEGRYPQNENELLVSYDYVKWSKDKPKIGDTITLEIGDRVSENGDAIYYNSIYGFSYKTNESVEENIKVRLQRTYKIVGVLSEDSTNAVMVDQNSACISVFTAADINKLSENAEMYVDLTPDGEKNYISAAAEISGLDEEQVSAYLSQSTDFSEEEWKEFYQKLTYESFSVNSTLLSYKGIGMSDVNMRMVTFIAIIVIAIIIIASVFTIRNSFAISITEKTRLYGMIASVGATSKQIRKNVLFEGFVLGLIGIPLGLLLGVGVAALILLFLNMILKDGLSGMALIYSMPILAVLLSVLLSAATIFFSTISSAIRASRIAPIDAIRSSNDVKLGKKQRSLRSPKLIKKLFGVGGDVAYKNLKRSRKKYRTTVISIIVSVALFISISCFMDYGTREIDEHYQTVDYNMSVNSNGDYQYENVKKSLESISRLEGVKSSRLYTSAGYEISTDNLAFSEEVKSQTAPDIDGYYFGEFFGITDDEFKEYTDKLGLNYDDVKDKGILYNVFEYKDADGKSRKAKYFNIEKGTVFECVSTFEKSDPDYSEMSIEIACDTDMLPYDIPYTMSSGTVFVRQEWMEKNCENGGISLSLNINAENADKLEQDILDLGYTGISVFNMDKTARIMNSMYLAISIFIYGFIIVITLIGVTNIFNTITTNMRLRSKEFAMLKSIGMTKREFNRMVRLESIFYGLKSLIIGIPLGTIGGYLIFLAFNANNRKYEFIFPWLAILISVVFVFAIVWLIMRFSIAKVQKQNIIETIRKDNI